MGLDIGFAHKIRWMARPGWDFGDLIVEYQGDATTISLDEMEALYDEFVKANIPEDTIDASEFMVSMRQYWGERGLAPTDSITMIVNS